MDATDALNRLCELFPIADYDTELIMFTNGDMEIEVFLTVEGARKKGVDCQNVTRVEGDSVQECMDKIEGWAKGNAWD
jgi:hypothetical protein